MPTRTRHIKPSLGIPAEYITAFYGHAARPTQSGVLTLRKITALIRAGYGQGHLHRYKPWLRVEKRDYSPNSPVGHLPAPEYGHMHHYRSRMERGALLIIRWLGAYDARDQFPVWPWDHRHPLYGLPGQGKTALVRGLRCLAIEEGVKLRVSAMRWIATLDVLSTWQDTDGSFRLVAHQVRPTELMLDPTAWTANERMELLRRYALAIDARHHLVGDLLGHEQLLLNLDALRPPMSREQRCAIRASREYRVAVELCARWAYREPLARTQSRIAAKLGLSMPAVVRLVNLALWHQDVDHDLSRPLEPWFPLMRGGQALKKTLHNEWSGRTV